MIPPWTKSNPEQVPVLRPVYTVKPTKPDSDRLDLSVMHEQDDNLEPLNNELAHAKARASSALGGAALRGALGQALSQANPEYSVEEEEVEVEEEETEEQGAPQTGRPLTKKTKPHQGNHQVLKPLPQARSQPVRSL